MSEGMKDSLPIIALCIGFFLAGGFVFSGSFRAGVWNTVQWAFRPRKGSPRPDKRKDTDGVPDWARDERPQREPTFVRASTPIRPTRKTQEEAPLYVSQRSRNNGQQELEDGLEKPDPDDEPVSGPALQQLSVAEAKAFLKKRGFAVRKKRAK